jgi:hypothetical protein
MQTEWDEKKNQLEMTSRGLVELEKQLQGELSKLEEQRNDLLPTYGGDEAQKTGDAGKAEANLPKVEDKKARASLERFQKLCRDAKRRAVGAG